MVSIDELMRVYDGEVPGASLLVMRGDDPVVMESWGYADLATRARAHSETNYRLASVTKQFTATAILLLAREGALSLDDRVSRLLPELPRATREVTIRHLLTHTSGIVDYEELIPEDQVEQVRDADVLALLTKEDRLLFEPGTDYHYSNSGYALLALVVERASGLSFATFLRGRIFEPLGMRNSVAFEQAVSTVANRAYGHSRDEAGEWRRDDQSVTSAVLGDGGIYTSIDDLIHWIRALDDDTLLPAEWRRLLVTPATETDRAGVAYGFGWRIDPDGTRWHTGSTRGFRNVIVRDPSRELTVVVLTNRNEGDVHAIARRIGALF